MKLKFNFASAVFFAIYLFFISTVLSDNSFASTPVASNAIATVTQLTIPIAGQNELLPDLPLPIIANASNKLERDFVPELVTVPGTYFKLDKETCVAYQALIKAAKAAGHKSLRLKSAYRSYDNQNSLHEAKVRKLLKAYKNSARTVAATIVARPGESEHQLGNTIDIANNRLVQSFGKTNAGIWLAENAHHYGFILRYPQNKTDITGVMYEPWHYRYVGNELATYIFETGLTLEEYYIQKINIQELD